MLWFAGVVSVSVCAWWAMVVAKEERGPRGEEEEEEGWSRELGVGEGVEGKRGEARSGANGMMVVEKKR